MVSVLQSPEDTWSFQPLEGAHFQRFQRHESVPHAAQPAAELENGLSLDAMANKTDAMHNDNTQEKWTERPVVLGQKEHPEVCIPTNPGTLLHPGSCTPCALVFRVAEGQVRNRCTNGDNCGWCHHPSHPRTRGRRQKSSGAARQKEAAAQEDKNGNGSETSTRDSWSDRETKRKDATWSEGDDRPKSSTRRESGKEQFGKDGKGKGAVRDDRGKNNRQRNDRDDRSKHHRAMTAAPPPMEKVERCNTPDFDECAYYANYNRPPQHPQVMAGVMQENCYGQPTPILYSCVPVNVNVAVPAPAAEGMPEWAGYPTTTTYVPDWNSQYQGEVRPYAPQQYMMLHMPQPQPQHQWGNGVRMELDGQEHHRPVAGDR
jgi:hypothetical protein